MGKSAWIFGYGSLIWRPAFEFVRRESALLEGFSRRFWQGSVDHRGTPEAPGRVVTLVPGGQCAGMAYEIELERLGAVLALLDQREQGGYRQRTVQIRIGSESDRRDAVTYVAEPGNPNYLGPASLVRIAHTLRESRGPSGTNLEYVSRLGRALHEIGAHDEHVSAVLGLLGDARLSA
jgi:cation transport regulator ChaC